MPVLQSIDLIAGARPNFMKIAPIINALKDSQRAGGTLGWRLVHTGQHYDQAMSQSFFEQLNIPHPDVNLEAGSGTQAEQTAAIMVKYERLILAQKPDLCLVVGDVNSTVACALSARKVGVPVAHVEAGIRSGDWSMPEEVNRVATDAISNWFFTTSDSAGENLRRCGIEDDRIFFVGNTMIDTLNVNLERLKPPPFWGELALQPQQYFVVTLHRPANVDSPVGLARLLNAIGLHTRGLPVVFPAHPRTAKILSQIDTIPKNIRFVEPQPYLEFNYLVRHAKAVVTDSGGITEETTVMGVPCMTLRANTERPETVTLGTNELLGTDPVALEAALDRLFVSGWKRGTIPPLWDGRASERIVAKLNQLLTAA